MTLDAGLDGAARVKRLGADFDETKAAIDGQQLGAHVEDGDVDGLAAVPVEVVFGGLNDAAAQARTLVSGIDGQHAEIAMRAAQLGIDGGQQTASSVFENEHDTLLHHGGQAVVVGAGATEEGFDGEGGVNEGDEAGAVGGSGQAGVEVNSRFAVHIRILMSCFPRF